MKKCFPREAIFFKETSGVKPVENFTQSFDFNSKS